MLPKWNIPMIIEQCVICTGFDKGSFLRVPIAPVCDQRHAPGVLMRQMIQEPFVLELGGQGDGAHRRRSLRTPQCASSSGRTLWSAPFGTRSGGRCRIRPMRKPVELRADCEVRICEVMLTMSIDMSERRDHHAYFGYASSSKKLFALLRMAIVMRPSRDFDEHESPRKSYGMQLVIRV